MGKAWIVFVALRNIVISLILLAERKNTCTFSDGNTKATTEISSFPPLANMGGAREKATMPQTRLIFTAHFPRGWVGSEEERGKGDLGKRSPSSLARFGGFRFGRCRHLLLLLFRPYGMGGKGGKRRRGGGIPVGQIDRILEKWGREMGACVWSNEVFCTYV